MRRVVYARAVLQSVLQPVLVRHPTGCESFPMSRYHDTGCLVNAVGKAPHPKASKDTQAVIGQQRLPEEGASEMQVVHLPGSMSWGCLQVSRRRRLGRAERAARGLCGRHALCAGAQCLRGRERGPGSPDHRLAVRCGGHLHSPVWLGHPCAVLAAACYT